MYLTQRDKCLMHVKTINIARDFCRTPGGRTREDGKWSGEAFREDVLVPALNEIPPFDKIVIELDGVLGYPVSFLEEAFGGAVRAGILNLSEFQSRIELRNTSPTNKLARFQIEEYVREAAR